MDEENTNLQEEGVLGSTSTQSGLTPCPHNQEVCALSSQNSLIDDSHITQDFIGSTNHSTSFTQSNNINEQTHTTDVHTQCEHSDVNSHTTSTQTQSVTFTPLTCSELVKHLTDDQILREALYFKGLNGSPLVRETRNGPTISQLREAIEQVHTGTFTEHHSHILELMSNFSCTARNINDRTVQIQQQLDSAMQFISKIAKPHTSVTVSDPKLDLESDHEVRTHEQPEKPDCDHATESHLDPISFHKDCPSLDMDEIFENINFTKISNREVAYFGNTPYSYAGITHEARPYPDLLCFKTMTNAIQEYDPEFNLDKYTCTASLYRSGDQFIPPHSDDETSIVPGGDIHTVCVGAERTIRYTNLEGPLDVREYQLPSGTVYSMTQESQSHWQHGIIQQPKIRDPRIAFTFRPLRKPTASQRTAPPPIHKPIATSVPTKNKIRVLFLTDSVHAKFPCNLFDDNFVCIKKMLFQLKDIGNYEKEFGYTDVVIISSGINDLSRYGATPAALLRDFLPKLRLYSNKFPTTKFMYSSLLETKYNWVNVSSHVVNDAIFKLSLTLDNIWFFDIWNLLSPSESLVYNHGVHITLYAQRVFRRTLITCTKLLHECGSTIRQHWPLRPLFRQMAAAHRQGNY